MTLLAGSNSVSIKIVTYAQILQLVSTNKLKVGTTYQIEYICNSTWQNTIGIFIATSKNTLSNTGQGIFLNADYNNIGVYTNPLININIGVWNDTLSVSVGNVAIYNNNHYYNLTGINTSTDPANDNANWSILDKAIENGYVKESCNIEYNVVTDYIFMREDTRNNIIRVSDTDANNIYFFRWGDDTTTGNTINSSSVNICNSVQEFVGNIVINGSSIQYIYLGATYQITNCTISNSIVTPNINDTQLVGCQIYNSVFATLVENCIISDSIFNNCNFDNNSSITLTECTLQSTTILGSNSLIILYSIFRNVSIAEWHGTNTQFNKCNFIEYNMTSYTFNNLSHDYCTFNDIECVYRIKMQLNGTVGNGAVGSIGIPDFPVRNNFFWKETLYYVNSPIIAGVGSYISIGIATDAATAGLDATTGLVTTMNTQVTNQVPANTFQKSNNDRIVVANVNVAAIMNAELYFIVKIQNSFIP